MKPILIIDQNGEAFTLHQNDGDPIPLAITDNGGKTYSCQPGEVLVVDEVGGSVIYPSLKELPPAMIAEDYDGNDRVFLLNGALQTYEEWVDGIDDPITEATKDWPESAPGTL